MVLLFVGVLNGSLSLGRAPHKTVWIQKYTFARVHVTPSGVMGSLWKDAYTNPQPTAGLLPPRLSRSKTQLVWVQQLSLGQLQQSSPSTLIFFICHKEGFVFFAFFFVCFFNLYLSFSIKHDAFYCWIFNFLFGISILSFDCFLKLWVCGQAAHASAWSLLEMQNPRPRASHPESESAS